MRAAAGFQAVLSGTASDWVVHDLRPTLCGLVGGSSLGWSVLDRHRGHKVFPGVHTHWTEPSTLLRLPLFTLASHLLPSNTINNPPPWCIFHNPADDLTIDPTTTIPLDQLLGLDDPQEWPKCKCLSPAEVVDSGCIARWRAWVAPRQRNRRAMGRISQRSPCGSSIDGTATRTTGNDDMSGPSTSCPIRWSELQEVLPVSFLGRGTWGKGAGQDGRR
ncbi:hypothetical protein B0T18DRAFT_200987 [Schizothecium vesticola]|uniref:Uncharacterized protein n=1 Tax=Schizothecium vesticola TaxID=314040 RepID=A0AA40BTA4_9PEZI|nr:hypothetical protein B0T18DRAFT_200987 [Schizothecium vesticola]